MSDDVRAAIAAAVRALPRLDPEQEEQVLQALRQVEEPDA